MADKGAAVIVEPRRHAAMKFVLWSMFQALPSSWPVYWFHGTHTEPKKLLAHSCFEPFRSRVRLVSLNVSNLSISMYNRLLTSVKFWKPFVEEHILIFQTDSGMIFQSPHNIEQFMSYDYVGAPWKPTLKKKYAGYVGNGGFSLRRRSAMLRVIQAMPYSKSKYGNEDIYFAYHAQRKGLLRAAPYNIAKRFAVESDSHAHPFPMAFHKPWDFGASFKTHETQLVKRLQ